MGPSQTRLLLAFLPPWDRACPASDPGQVWDQRLGLEDRVTRPDLQDESQAGAGLSCWNLKVTVLKDNQERPCAHEDKGHGARAVTRSLLLLSP